MENYLILMQFKCFNRHYSFRGVNVDENNSLLLPNSISDIATCVREKCNSVWATIPKSHYSGNIIVVLSWMRVTNCAWCITGVNLASATRYGIWLAARKLAVFPTRTNCTTFHILQLVRNLLFEFRPPAVDQKPVVDTYKK